MDLKIKDVAELLSVSETTIRRWLSDGKIPAYRLNRQYRFSRIEIENWMLKQKLSLSAADTTLEPIGETQIYPTPEEGIAPTGRQQFSLYRALNRGDVIHDVSGNSKEEVIRNAVEQIAPSLRFDPEVLSEMLLDRERLMPTALNSGMAIPHARECLQHVPFDLVTVVFLSEPIEYGALDGKPVDTLFFLFATGDKIHLHLLAKIAHLTSNAQGMKCLKTRPEKGPLLEFVREWEGSIRVAHPE